MKAIVKLLHSLELEDSLVKYWPDDVENFGTWVRAYIGPATESGSEAFDILVCTPNWLKSKCASEGPMLGRHMLIISSYDFDEVKSFIDCHVAQCSGDDWTSIATRVSRIGAWEFEDYKP